jgi:hypothetical protein
MKKIVLFSVAAAFLLTAFTTVQIFTTSLKITVLNELGNAEEDVEVQLYSTDEDYRNEENPVTDIALTNKRGKVKFKDLDPAVYYIMARKGDKNNWGAGVQTDSLQERKLNKVTLIIE